MSTMIRCSIHSHLIVNVYRSIENLCPNNCPELPELKLVDDKNKGGVEAILRLDAATVLHGPSVITRYLVRLVPECRLYGGDPVTSALVDDWLENVAAKCGGGGAAAAEGSAVTAVPPGAGASTNVKLERALTDLNQQLTLRTCLLGHSLSLADVAAHAHLANDNPEAAALLMTHQEASSRRWPHLMRWFNYVAFFVLPQNQQQLVRRTANAARTTGATSNKQAKTDHAFGSGLSLGHMGSFNKHLKLHGLDAEGRVADGGLPVCTRFPPEPSGYLHVGHVKAALLNRYFARRYNGRLLVRFDDTNPSKEKAEFEDAILADLATLDVRPDAVSYTSDHFEYLLATCERLIKAGLLYVDDTPAEQIQQQRFVGQESEARRTYGPDRCLALWQEMVQGTDVGRQCVVRARLNMKDPNKALRDPAMYRCVDSDVVHVRTKDRFKVYPLYDFACPLVDSLEGVTHALRSSEYSDRNPLYRWVCEAAGVRAPQIEDFSRVNFEYVLLSKRKLQQLVDTGVADSWSDPRFPTVRGILRRGLETVVLKDYILSLGASKSTVSMSLEKLWVLNKKYLDPRVPRFFAVNCDQRVLVRLSNGPAEPELRSRPLHPKEPGLGRASRLYGGQVWLDASDARDCVEGEEVTLMDWGNAVWDKVGANLTTTDAGPAVIETHLHLEGSVRTTKRKLTWLPAAEDGGIGDLVPLELRSYDHLLTVPKVKPEHDLDAVINRNSEHRVQALGDAAMRLLPVGAKLQLQRRGYFRVDQVISPTNPKMVLIEIPTG